MAEDNPEDALKVCIREMRDGAKDAPHNHTSTDIKDTLVEDHKGPIRDAFFRNFKDHGPKKWEEDRDNVLRMARYIGILAVFFAEANHKNQIGEEELLRALALVNVECKNLADALRRAQDPSDKREVWCS
jgi:hypothetical protein